MQTQLQIERGSILPELSQLDPAAYGPKFEPAVRRAIDSVRAVDKLLADASALLLATPLPGVSVDREVRVVPIAQLSEKLHDPVLREVEAEVLARFRGVAWSVAQRAFDAITALGAHAAAADAFGTLSRLTRAIAYPHGVPTDGTNPFAAAWPRFMRAS